VPPNESNDQNQTTPNPNAGTQNQAPAFDPVAFENKLMAQNRKMIDGALETFAKKLGSTDRSENQRAENQRPDGQPAGQTKADLEIATLKRQLEEVSAKQNAAIEEARQAKISEAIIANSTGKVRTAMTKHFSALVAQRIKTAEGDGTLFLDLDGKSFGIAEGISELLKRDDFAGFREEPKAPPRRSVNAPEGGPRAVLKFKPEQISKMSGDDLINAAMKKD